MGEQPGRGRSGGCLCGAVRYQVRGPLRDVVNCHCSRCRRTHGHFGAYTEVTAGHLPLLEDRGLGWYVADGRERGFCRECGASLFWRRAGAAATSVAAGTFDEPTELRTVANIYVDSKGDYYEIRDELPKRRASGDAEPARRRAVTERHGSPACGCRQVATPS